MPSPQDFFVDGQVLFNVCIRGRQKHNAKWMAIYNDFVDCYENGMAMIEIAKRNNVSKRTIYRYKAYYDKMRNTKENVIE